MEMQTWRTDYWTWGQGGEVGKKWETGTDITDSEEEVVSCAERGCELAGHLFALTLHLLVASTGMERHWRGAWLTVGAL